jgi:divalent metal cation (Fe/Co/Zn/Cd) transporter
LIVLLGPGINLIWHIWWIDPVAALVIVSLILREGRAAMRGHVCGRCGFDEPRMFHEIEI